MVHDSCGFLLKQTRGEYVGNAGGNGKLHRGSAAHQYTKRE